MKLLKKYFLIMCLLPFIYSCKKDSIPANNITIAKDTLSVLTSSWRVIKDSVTNNNYVFPWNGAYPLPGIYYGNYNDYYLFDKNFNISIFENGLTYKSKYQLLSNSMIIIDQTDPLYIGIIKILNSTSATFEWALKNNNGTYFRRLTLTK